MSIILGPRLAGNKIGKIKLSKAKEVESEITGENTSPVSEVVDLGDKQVEFKYASGSIDKYIEEAKKKYNKLHGNVPDAISEIRFSLPMAVDSEGRSINLNKYLNDTKASVPLVECGKALLILSVQKKNNKPIFFIHTFEKEPLPMVIGKGSNSPVILPTVKYTERGLEEV